jgi:hypothetical protein
LPSLVSTRFGSSSFRGPAVTSERGFPPLGPAATTLEFSVVVLFASEESEPKRPVTRAYE